MAAEAKESDPTPIVFAVRGLKPDTRLKVFSQEYVDYSFKFIVIENCADLRYRFHVHSMILKQHSNWFFKFMDSVDKVDNAPTQGLFAYEYVTKVDDDVTWSLGAASDLKVCVFLCSSWIFKHVHSPYLI